MNSTRKKIYLSPPHMSNNEQAYIEQAFSTNWIAPFGPNVDAFEKELADYVGTKDAAALSSGTAAIHLALKLLGVKAGDTVFCSTLTFVASANPILYQGAEPVFIDSEPDTWNMSPLALERAFLWAVKEGKLPKAVIIVNLYGQSAKLDELLQLCDAYGVPVIEDAAESLGTIYKGRASGSLGRFGIYSFNGNKIISTSGGGMLISDDTDAIQRARFLASQAKDQALYYQHSQIGYNYRMSNVLAGIGRAQLQVLEDRVHARRAVFNKYYEAIGQLPGVQFMEELEDTRSNRWLTALTLKADANVTPSSLITALTKEEIEARMVWKPLHLQPVFHGCNIFSHTEEQNVSERLFHTGICLPSGSNLTDNDIDRVIGVIKRELSSNFAKSIM